MSGSSGWPLATACASRAFHARDGEQLSGAAKAYQGFLEMIERERSLHLRVLPDILTGASAGGINAVFLAGSASIRHSIRPGPVPGFFCRRPG